MDDDRIRASVAIIREAFGTVAREFNLTKDNCPTHPSLVTFEQLRGLQRKGQRFFGLFSEGRQVGFVAVDNGDGARHYMERLAVLPEHRHNGYGVRLVYFALDCATEHRAAVMSIGIIDEHTILKKWYESLGFVETGTKKFSHLPFSVCFMEIGLSSRRSALTSDIPSGGAR